MNDNKKKPAPKPKPKPVHDPNPVMDHKTAYEICTHCSHHKREHIRLIDGTGYCTGALCRCHCKQQWGHIVREPLPVRKAA